MTVAGDRLQREEPTSVGVAVPDRGPVRGRGGIEGELVARSPAQMSGYFGDDAATAAATTAEARSAPATSAGSTSAAGSSSPAG